MKYYIIAGEASGDLHGSNLIRELTELDKTAKVRCWGGDLMQAAGGDVVKHYRDLAFMGFIEVVKNLPTILNNLKFCKKDILGFQPDVLILIDYPGFNLRIAKWAKQQGVKVIYYISPQVWAWKESRVKTIKQAVDKMLVILPFEKEFYARWNYGVEYVGHPLVHFIDQFDRLPDSYIIHGSSGEQVEKKMRGGDTIILLPGSRSQEIQVKLPIMLETSRFFPGLKFIIAQAPGQNFEVYKELIRSYPNVEVALPGQTYRLLAHAKAALVTSGTATLETALFGVPQVVCYKGSAVSYYIARRLIKIKYISLVNLIMDKEVVKELIQDELTAEQLKMELSTILYDNDRIQHIKKDYRELKALLSAGGNASANAAAAIIDFLN